MKKLIVSILCIALGTSFFVGCSKETLNDGSKPTEEDKEVVMKEVKVVAPDGLPAISIAKLAKENPDISDGYEVKYTIESTSDGLSTTVMKQEPDIAIVPSNMAAIAYNKTSNYQIAGTVGMGSFYLVSTEDLIDFKDLVGKEVGNTGKGLTPDITVQTVLKDQGVNVGDINFNYTNTVNELVPLLATGKLKTAFVPEPALTALLSKNENIKIIKSLNDSWKESMGSKEGYPQSTVIVKSDFAKDNKDFVEDFLLQLSNSIDWANSKDSKLGEYCKEIKISTQPQIIDKAMDRANLKFVYAKDMIEDYNNYYQKLIDFDAKTVGGKLPDEGIYFIQE